jgi:Uma2 family endonuclease
MPDALTKPPATPATPAVGPDDPFYGLEEPISVETYLRIERQAERKHEYHQGTVRLMPGASRQHSKLTIALGSLLLRSVDPSCGVHSSDMSVWIESAARFLYPDVSVACGEEAFLEDHAPDALLNPTLVAEVLSPSTEGYDRGAKFALYQTVPSLRTYVLVAQDRRRVEVFDRLDAPNRWELRTYGPDAATVALPTLDAEIDLDALYARVDLGAA